MLDLRRISVFREVATRRSFSGAASALSYTQSTVSQAVSELERELGVTLLDRSSRPVRPTHAGDIVLAHAEELLGRADVIEQELAALGRGETGRLRVAGFSTAWATFMPAAVAGFGSAHPGVELSVEQHEPGPALKRLASGDLDVAVVYRFAEGGDADPGPRFAQAHLFDDAYALVLPVTHRLARGKRPVPLADLARERWVMPPAASSYTRAFHAFCWAAGGFEPDVAYETNEVAMVQPLVATGLAVAFLPRLNLVRPHPRVTIRELREPPPARSVWAVRPADRSLPAARAMVRQLRESASGPGIT